MVGWGWGRQEKAKEGMLDPAPPSTQTSWEVTNNSPAWRGDTSDGEERMERQRGHGDRREGGHRDGDTQSKHPWRKQTRRAHPPPPEPLRDCTSGPGLWRPWKSPTLRFWASVREETSQQQVPAPSLEVQRPDERIHTCRFRAGAPESSTGTGSGAAPV